MATNKHHIDQLFEDSLSNLLENPSESVWNGVAKNLDYISTKKSNKKLKIQWISYSAAVIAVAIYLFAKSCSIDSSAAKYYITERYQSQKINLLSSNSPSKPEKTNSNHIKSIKKSILSTAKNSSQSNQIPNTINELHTNKNKILANYSSQTIQDIVDIQAINKSADILEQKTNNTITPAENRVAEVNIKELEAVNNEVVTETEEEVLVTINQETKVDQTTAIAPENIAAIAGKKYTTGLSIGVLAGVGKQKSNFDFQPLYESPNLNMNIDNSLLVGEFSIYAKFKISKFYIQSGFNYSDFNHNINLNTRTEMHDTSGGYISWNMNKYWTYDTIGYYDDPNNPGLAYAILQPTFHSDTIGSQWNSRDEIYYINNNYKATNRYQYIEIPIVAGIDLQWKKLNLYLGSGLGIGKMVNTTGKYIFDDRITEISNSNNPYASNNLNLILNLGAGYALTNKWNLILQTNYKRNITSIYKAQPYENIKYQSIGFQLGMSYNLK